MLGSSLSQVITLRKLCPREHCTQHSTNLYSLHKAAPRWLPYCQRVNKKKQISCFGSLILFDSDADIFNTQSDIQNVCSAIDLTLDNLPCLMVISLICCLHLTLILCSVLCNCKCLVPVYGMNNNIRDKNAAIRPWVFLQKAATTATSVCGFIDNNRL